jgi:hypothetical protein
VTVTDLLQVPVEPHFTEGEPDLEPPEELAIAELDEQAMLEEELDNEDVLEQDVDEDALEAALDDLVHAGDDLVDDETDAGAGAGAHIGFPTPAFDSDDGSVRPGAGADRDDEAMVADDHEDALDVVLLVRSAFLGAGSEPAGDDEVAIALVVIESADSLDLAEVAPCGRREFVCRSCFLVRTRAQLADAATLTCVDCGT